MKSRAQPRNASRSSSATSCEEWLMVRVRVGARVRVRGRGRGRVRVWH